MKRKDNNIDRFLVKDDEIEFEPSSKEIAEKEKEIGDRLEKLFKKRDFNFKKKEK